MYLISTESASFGASGAHVRVVGAAVVVLGAVLVALARCARHVACNNYVIATIGPHKAF
jgi:hypothetical protein